MKTKTTLFYLFILFCFINVSQLLAQGDNCTAISSGSWHDASTWSCNHVPVAGDFITIDPGAVVTISELVYIGAGESTSIEIYGQLLFNPPPCSGNGCFISLSLATGSTIYVDQEFGIDLGDNGIPGQTYVYIGSDVVLHGGDDFPWGPGTLPFAPLPVELSAFYGTALERSNILKWQTASEENTLAFLVERSLDGRDDFEEIGRVDAFGNSTSVRNYGIEDENPFSLTYYRLRIVDFDGSFEFSDVIAVERSKTEIDLVEVYPVPAEVDVTVLVHARVEGKAILTLSDFMGRKINEETITLKAGINHYTFDFGDHETNFYYLTIYNGKEKISRKILRATKD